VLPAWQWTSEQSLWRRHAVDERADNGRACRSVPLRPDESRPVHHRADFHQIGGPDDYQAVERRDDVLVYTTDAVAAPIEVCGLLRATLYAASSARDTDWTMK